MTTRRRNVYISTKETSEEIIFIGGDLCIHINNEAPVSTEEFSVTWDHKDLQVFFKKDYKPVTSGEKLQHNFKNCLSIHVKQVSSSISDRKITIEFFDKTGSSLKKRDLLLTCVYLSLDVDADRDGKVEQNSPDKNSWNWGPNGHGAIVLVNRDQDGDVQEYDEGMKGLLNLEDMSQMMVRSRGPPQLPDMYTFHFNVEKSTAKNICIYDLNKGIAENTPLIGPKSFTASITYPGKNNESKYAIEALRFPDKDFDGLIKIHLILSHDNVPVFEDIVQFRVAPWIMTPNTLDVQQIYVCKTDRNKKNIEELQNMVEKIAGKKLSICEHSLNRGDCWMQDEIELGYTASPHKVIPVLLDSPRHKVIQTFVQCKLLGDDFLYIRRYGKEVNSLDSFGNLEVSPPVTVHNKNYPLGRILIGSNLSLYQTGRFRIREVTSEFLQAQLVQPVVELFSDWLLVGHIDEFMTFVPSTVGREFRLLLASPNICIKILTKLKNKGLGDTIFEDREHFCPDGNTYATTTVNELLNNSAILADSMKCQEFIDWNRNVLKYELGLTEEDIIDIPCLFMSHASRFFAYFPDLVNILVVGKHLGIQKPFGPVINGECAFEHYVKSVLEPLGLVCHFIDDWDIYYMKNGEVHCGTNALRKPFKDVNWWDVYLY